MDFSEIFWVDHQCKVAPPQVKSQLFLDDEPFSIFHINVCSFNQHLTELELLLADMNINFSCIVISETWFTQSTYKNKFAMKGYNFYCSSRVNGGGGGIAVYVSDKFEARCVDVRLVGSEALLVHVGRGGRAVSSVLAIYRAPSGLVRDFLGDLEEHLSSLPSGSNSIVIGDLNIDINKNNYLDNNSTMYLDLIGQYGFYNTIFFTN